MKIKLFGRILEIKASASGVSALPSLWDDSGWSSYLAGRGYSVPAETALQISAVFRCIDLGSKTIAALPLHLYRRTPNGKEKATENPLYQMLYVLPNPQTTAYEFWQMYVANIMLTRGGFAKIKRDYRGKITALWNLPTHRVSGIHINSVSGERYIDVFADDGKNERLREGEFMYTPGFLFNERTVPHDAMTIASEVLGLTKTITQYARQSVDSINPGGFIEYPNGLSDQAYNRFKADFEANYKGVTNAGKFLFLEEGGKAALLQRDLEKMQVLESRKHAVTEVCRIWGIPPHMCMDLEKATFSNIEQQSAEFVRDFVNPLTVRLEQTQYRDLLSESERLTYFSKFNTNALLRGDTATRTTYYNVMRQGGLMDGDEIRGLEDMENMPDGLGKIFTVNGNMIPLSAVPMNLPKGAQATAKGVIT